LVRVVRMMLHTSERGAHLVKAHCRKIAMLHLMNEQDKWLLALATALAVLAIAVLGVGYC
jgi:hypothetical protein